MRRLFDVSVSILMAAVLLMSQSWAVTAAYADYSVNGSTDSTNLNSEDSNAIDDGSGPEGQESNASPVVNESQDTQQGSSEDRSEVVADDSAVSNQLTVKNVSVSAHVQNIGWMDPVGSGNVAGTTGRGLNLEALKISLEVDGATSQEQVANALSVEAHVSNVGWQAAVGNGGTAGTTGQARAVEALRVRLSAGLSARYTVWYRVHSAEFGWLGWACDAPTPARRATAAPSRPSRSRSCPRATPPRATLPVLLRTVAMIPLRFPFARIHRILAGCLP